MAKDEIIRFRIDSETKAKLQKLADEDNRTLSSYITNLLMQEIKKSEQ